MDHASLAAISVATSSTLTSCSAVAARDAFELQRHFGNFGGLIDDCQVLRDNNNVWQLMRPAVSTSAAVPSISTVLTGPSGFLTAIITGSPTRPTPTFATIERELFYQANVTLNRIYIFIVLKLN